LKRDNSILETSDYEPELMYIHKSIDLFG